MGFAATLGHLIQIPNTTRSRLTLSPVRHTVTSVLFMLLLIPPFAIAGQITADDTDSHGRLRYKKFADVRYTKKADVYAPDGRRWGHKPIGTMCGMVLFFGTVTVDRCQTRKLYGCGLSRGNLHLVSHNSMLTIYGVALHRFCYNAPPMARRVVNADRCQKMARSRS